MTLRVSKIRISNLLGIEELELEPGRFTAVTGRNGQGKTSTLEAIKSVVRGGHDATLLRNGADKGEVVLVLDDGTEIGKRVTPASSTQVFKGADGKRSTRPAEAIKALTDALSVNPLEWLTVPKKQQVAALLEAMPLTADLARLSQLTGIQIDDALAGQPALDVIEQVRRQIYDERTGTNRAIKEKEATINQLAAAIPESLGAAAGGEDEIRQQIEALDAARDAELARVDAKLAGIESAHEAKAAEIRDQIDALRLQLADLEAKRATVRQSAEKQRSLARQQRAEQVAPLEQQIAIIAANRDAAARAAVTRQTIERMSDEAEQLRADAETAGKILSALDGYKSELLASLPIPGLEVVSGDVLYRGVPLDRVNTAQQMQIAVELAKLRAGSLGLICVDGAERLDPAAFEQFRDAALASGLQLVVTRVDDGPLAVEVVE